MKVIKYKILLLLFFANIVHANTIIFKTNGFHYTLKSSEELISLQGYLIDLNFRQRKCNKALIASFHQQITKNLKTKVITDKNYYSTTIDGKEYNISQSSDLGKYLYNFPLLAKSNKQKEAFLCRK